MQLLILAAGLGKRLQDISTKNPKSLVPILGSHSYLSLELLSFSRFAFEKKIIVGGFAFEKLEKFLHQPAFTDFELLFNKDFHKGNLFTLKTAQKKLNGSFTIFNADHFYSPQTYQKIFKKERSEITIFCDRDRKLTSDDMKVHQSDALQMSKQLTEYQWGYVGVTFVPKTRFAQYWQAVQAVEEKVGDRAHVEQVVQMLSQKGIPVQIVDISGSWWTEIDTPEDYEKTKAVIAKNWDEILNWIK